MRKALWLGGGVTGMGKITILGSNKDKLGTLIKNLFSNGEQGFFYDPNDLKTLYQDAAGTVPVTGVGQPVGLILDKSGNNNHAFQTNSASRPILRKNTTTGSNYLAFDGVDDCFVTDSIDFRSTDEINLFSSIRRADAPIGAGMLLELSNNILNNLGTFYLASPDAGDKPKSIAFGSKGLYLSRVFIADSTEPNVVISAKAKITTNTSILRLNGVQQGSSTTSQGTTVRNYRNYPLYIGRRNSAVITFNGHIYSLLGIGRLTTEVETEDVEKELAERVGVSLNV